MGAIGFPTRVLAPILGSYLSYCSPAGKLAAPGQIDPETIDNLYGFRSMSDSTAIYGIIGSPLAHSRSPLIHNKGFRALGLDAVYLPFPTDSLDDFFMFADLLGIRGLSVTIPFKEKVMRFAHALDVAVQEAGACNTLVKDDEGFFGYNTDIDGFLAPLRSRFSGMIPRGLRATVVGAGGAARACVYALVREGVKVLIVNRTADRARELAERFGCQWSGLTNGCAGRISECGDLIVQTTSAGMEPNIEEDPVVCYDFKGTEVAYDIVYKPPVTAFLERAGKAGCRLIYGKEMLREQAYVQFRLFTGKDYPTELANDPDLV
jgi:3-dehydroquinate dehydratase/shikimate dehydrogenase